MNASHRPIPIMRRLSTHPYLIGFGIGAAVVCAIFVVDTWFPSIGEALGQHHVFIRDSCYTAGIVYYALFRYWRWHRRAALWIVLITLVAVQAAFLIAYTRFVHDLYVQEWLVVLAADFIALHLALDGAFRPSDF
jgi:hypothetical protein